MSIGRDCCFFSHFKILFERAGIEHIMAEGLSIGVLSKAFSSTINILLVKSVVERYACKTMASESS
jgi:hypothetical protein